MSLKSFCTSQFPHKFVNVSFNISYMKGLVDEFVRELTFAKRLSRHFVLDKTSRLSILPVSGKVMTKKSPLRWKTVPSHQLSGSPSSANDTCARWGLEVTTRERIFIELVAVLCKRHLCPLEACGDNTGENLF